MKFDRSDPQGISLRELILVHRQFHGKGSLARNIGDGFLCSENRVYRNIREEYLRLGFAYTLEDIGGYFSFPLMSLDEVIDARVAPYRDNFSWLEKLEKVAPEKFTLSDIKRSEIQFNYLFHESAHFIAHSYFWGRKSIRRVPKNSDALLKIFLGEAFANTVESLSAALVEGEIGSFFLDANCHFRADEKEVRSILGVASRCGFDAAARAIFSAFLYSNFMYEGLGKKQLKLVQEFSGIANLRDVRAMVRIGLMLSIDFRATTTQLHLIKVGFPLDFPRLMRFDPLAFLLQKKNKKLIERTKALIGVATAGISVSTVTE